MIEVQKEIKQCDILIVGGGIAGLMAAIAAADKGAKVIVAEKADSRRSGSAATGNDHFLCYIPEVHGENIEAYVDELAISLVGDRCDRTLQRQLAERSFEVVKDWEKWGIEMRPHGDWEFNGHAMPGHMRIWLKYNGTEQKPILTKEAKKRGVEIDNHSPISEFLTDDSGKIIGAVAIDVSKEQPSVKLYQAKAIVTATGIGMRLYPSVTPGWMFNQCNCPAGTGAGRAAGYKVGATLCNIETGWTHAGPKQFERCGKATWIGVLKDRQGKPVGPFVTKPTKELGDITADIWQAVFVEKKENGTGPVFMDCTETAPEDMEYMRWGLECEGDTSLLDAMDKQGIDLGEDMVEFTKYKPNLQGKGLEVDIHHATDVPGLYCAGDEAGNINGGIGGAAVTGRIAGENAADYVKSIEGFADISEHSTVKKAIAFYSELMEREAGATWKELNIASQQILDDYAGITYVRSESMMKAGLTYLEQLDEAARKSVKCNNAHELMRALEAFDLLEISKLVILSAMERKESRGMHKRSDYTFTNPLLNGKIVTIKQVDGKPVTAMRDNY